MPLYKGQTDSEGSFQSLTYLSLIPPFTSPSYIFTSRFIFSGIDADSVFICEGYLASVNSHYRFEVDPMGAGQKEKQKCDVLVAPCRFNDDITRNSYGLPR